jgi:hypothetical protein
MIDQQALFLFRLQPCRWAAAFTAFRQGLSFCLQLSEVVCMLTMKGVVMWQRFSNRFTSRADMRDFFLMWAATVLGFVALFACLLAVVL